MPGENTNPLLPSVLFDAAQSGHLYCHQHCRALATRTLIMSATVVLGYLSGVLASPVFGRHAEAVQF